ncbi:MAG: hypothetical protein JWL95_902 [Gemmatimonadetes bacterium]|nr:hypothetical protein [Gemmatimonadota bacterium]
MTRTTRTLLLGGAVLFGAACAERISGSADQLSPLDAAFTTMPLGFEATASSFAGGGDGVPTAFLPSAVRGEKRGRNGLPGGHDFMGGGLGPDFMGGPLGGGRPFDGGGLPSSCVFSAATGVVTCPPEARDGLTVTRTATFKDASGKAQAARDSTTNSVTSHVQVTGTVTRRNGEATTVDHVSDQSVSGLAKGSTQRTVNGTSAGKESSSGSDSVGAFAVVRIVGDTTSGLIVPIAADRSSYPTAGSVVRSMRVTLTYTGQAAQTSSRRELITYDGTATAKLTIVTNGVTKSCTIALPRGRPICP